MIRKKLTDTSNPSSDPSKKAAIALWYSSDENISTIVSVATA